jgi:Tfp pilus assembly protein PilW
VLGPDDKDRSLLPPLLCCCRWRASVPLSTRVALVNARRDGQDPAIPRAGSSMCGSTIVCDAFHRRNQESALYQAERNVFDTHPASSTTWTCRSPVRTQQQRDRLRGCDSATW